MDEKDNVTEELKELIIEKLLSDPSQKVSEEIKYKIAVTVSFTVIRKYLQQLIINADKQGAKKMYDMVSTLP